MGRRLLKTETVREGAMREEVGERRCEQVGEVRQEQLPDDLLMVQLARRPVDAPVGPSRLAGRGLLFINNLPFSCGAQPPAGGGCDAQAARRPHLASPAARARPLCPTEALQTAAPDVAAAQGTHVAAARCYCRL